MPVRKPSFRKEVDEVAAIIREKGEITLPEICYRLDISTTKAYALVKAACEVYDNITYWRGVARYVKPEQQSGAG
jgi:hypothetical protein